ncbi:TlpA disulfide reductase family protein [Rhabdobacter roseus]|uniref:Thiol-disulfide isomerase/thioredoxin n=1 Tax=Rhabdobacter roseus TaxID=1655419 RepID=A0A840TND8_9BACT|nr:TlpA disulfide reductase family protein [Rhabdobacter roseus]MBB5283277.1 thiol-disulfide isomerase/thioredoxin [Rhabdobacter roseus]
MRTTLRTALWGLLLPWLFATCQSGPGTRTVKLTIQSTPQLPLPVKLDTLDMISTASLIPTETALDSAGRIVLELELPRPMFATLELGERFQTLYLTPGDELTIHYDTTGHRFRFEGTSAIANTYLYQEGYLSRQLDAGMYQRDIDLDTFIARLDSAKNILAEFHQHYLDSTGLSASLGTLFKQRRELGYLWDKQWFFRSHYYAEDNPDVPEVIANVWSEIPFDSTLLQTAMYSYSLVLDYYLDLHMYPSVYPEDASDAEYDSLETLFPFLAYEKIKQTHPSPAFQEYFQAKVLSYSLRIYGITPVIDSFYTQFKQTYPASRFRPSVETKYQQWVALSPGQPAPDIRGITPDGKAFSLRELRDKVVYVDVWATWCGPCVEQFSHAKKVKKQFEGNDQVAFLYVSVDQNTEAWKKYLRKNPDLTGVHINQNPDAEGTSSVYEDYLINGIPRFILIDPQGKIVNVKAVAPSNGELEKEIRKVLGRQQPVASL